MDLFLAGIRTAKADILLNRVVEQGDILKYKGEIPHIRKSDIASSRHRLAFHQCTQPPGRDFQIKKIRQHREHRQNRAVNATDNKKKHQQDEKIDLPGGDQIHSNKSNDPNAAAQKHGGQGHQRPAFCHGRW